MPPAVGTLKRAGVVLLDYSTAANFRQENSVIYVSNDWEELARLLGKSKRFLDGLPGIFRDRPGTPVPTPAGWTINEPHTIVIVPILGELSQAVRTISIVRPDLRKELQKVLGEVRHTIRYDFLYEKLDPFLDEAFGGPGFIVEYAIETGVAWIRYHRPKQPTPVRYKGTLTPATVGNILVDNVGTAPLRTGTASLHFDIGMDPGERANFAVDYIEQPNFAAASFSTKILVGDCVTAPPGPNMSRTVPIKPTPAPIFLNDPLDPFGPSAVMEIGVDGGDPCCVCLGIMLREAEMDPSGTEVTSYYMSDAIFKLYCDKEC
ncbi:MAG: hypothetical protein AKCLJLPJ_02386 [Fimbriimonadales bacterium]|nr:hypothetical protein [Fimbriimonadales bacterium]